MTRPLPLPLLLAVNSCNASRPGETHPPPRWWHLEPHASGLLLNAAHRPRFLADTGLLRLTPTATTDTNRATDALGYGVGNLHRDRLAVAHYARACH